MNMGGIGPAGLFTIFKDNWLVTRKAANLFLLSTIFVLASLPVFFGQIGPNKLTFWSRLPWGIEGLLGPFSIFFLWIGMWRYWYRLDNSPKARKIRFVPFAAPWNVLRSRSLLHLRVSSASDEWFLG